MDSANAVKPKTREGRKKRSAKGAAQAPLSVNVNEQGTFVGEKQTSEKKKVHWNDDKGKKLIEVKEFLPSNPSDSEDEYVDTCLCKVM